MNFSSGDPNWLNYTSSTTPGFIMDLSLETGLIADGSYYPQRTVTQKGFNITNVIWPHDALIFNTNADACQSWLGHWKHLSYDPTLAVTFISPNTPSSGGNAMPIAVGVSVGAAAVVAIVGVLLRLFYPPCMSGSMKKVPIAPIGSK